MASRDLLSSLETSAQARVQGAKNGSLRPQVKEAKQQALLPLIQMTRNPVSQSSIATLSTSDALPLKEPRYRETAASFVGWSPRKGPIAY